MVMAFFRKECHAQLKDGYPLGPDGLEDPAPDRCWQPIQRTRRLWAGNFADAKGD